jgi:ATP-dependent helicase YprA (DUF1998 family)
MAPRLFEIHAQLMASALELVAGCRCAGGCPGCVGPTIGDHGANKRAALALLRRLCASVGASGSLGAAEARPPTAQIAGTAADPVAASTI